MGAPKGPVIGVIGGSGGVGASTFAGVLGVVAGARRRGSVLIDLDVAGGGLDVVLGIEAQPGARWSGLQLAGGYLEPSALRSGLPHVGPCAVLAADVGELDPTDLAQVVDVAAELGPVVLDLPRAQCAERTVALLRCDLVVVLARGDVAGLVSAHALVSALPELRIGSIVRRGDVAREQATRLIGVAPFGRLPPLAPPGRRFNPVRLPRATARMAVGVLDGAGARAFARVRPEPRPDTAPPVRARVGAG